MKDKDYKCPDLSYHGKVITTPVAEVGNVKKSNASKKKG